VSRHRAPRRRSREAALQVLYALDLARRERHRRGERGEGDKGAKGCEEGPEAEGGDAAGETRRTPGDPGGAEPAAQEMFERAAESFELPEGARAFAKELVVGVISCRDEIDALLSRCTQHWRLERMAAVDRNVLRLAGYELLHTTTPPAVVIDEAVELARRFGGERSPAFVNGVLDAAAHACGRVP